MIIISPYLLRHWFVLFICVLRVNDSNKTLTARTPQTNGFHTKIPAEERRSVMVLRLSADDLEAMNMRAEDVYFKPAKFDSSTSIGSQGLVEEYIVTACGMCAMHGLGVSSVSSSLCFFYFASSTLLFLSISFDTRVECHSSF